MRLRLTATRETVAAERQRRYLMAWPLAQQAEALHDAATGRPEKLDAMTADFAAIKAALPYPQNED